MFAGNDRWLPFAMLLAFSGTAILKTNSLRGNRSDRVSAYASLRSFEIVPLETVSETTANASVADLNGDGHLDIVLAKGRHWPLSSLVLFGDGRGKFTRGPALPNPPSRSYTAALADMTKR